MSDYLDYLIWEGRPTLNVDGIILWVCFDKKGERQILSLISLLIRCGYDVTSWLLLLSSVMDCILGTVS